MDGSSIRRHRFALAFLALLVAVFFLPALARRQVFTLRDHTDYFQPLRWFTAAHLRELTLPHWNPYNGSGEPWLANPQTGVFYPPTWLFIALPFETAYMAGLALHLAILGWGAYLAFARSVSPGAALLGATAVTFSGPVLSLLDVSNNLATFAWVPWAIWAGLGSVSPRLSGLILALAFLGGEPFFAALAAALYVAVRAFSPASAGEKVPEGRKRGPLGDILLTALVAIGLSAVQLFPFLELVRGSDRAAGLAREEIFRESMAPRDWVRVAVPPRLGPGGYDAALSQHFIPMIYVGMGVALLAVLAWIFVRRRAVAAWTLLLVTAAVIAAGAYFPLGRIFEILPVMPFRYPARVVPFGALALAGLASLAWERFRPRRRWVDLLLLLILLVDVVARAGPLLRTAPFDSDGVVRPAAAGHAAKIIRRPEGPLLDRQAWLAGYQNLYGRRFDAWTPAPVISARYSALHGAAVATGRLDLFAFIGAAFILSDAEQPQHLKPVGRVRDVTTYVTPTIPEMASIWTWWRETAGADESLRLLLMEGMGAGIPIAGAAAPSIERAGGRRLDVESLEIGTAHARAVIRTEEDGVLVLTQQDAPGWRVFVDGREREKLLAGGIFRAVEVWPGRHEVLWRWSSSSLRAGMIVTIITALSLQTGAFVKRFARRKFSSRRQKSQV